MNKDRVINITSYGDSDNGESYTAVLSHDCPQVGVREFDVAFGKICVDKRIVVCPDCHGEIKVMKDINQPEVIYVTPAVF